VNQCRVLIAVASFVLFILSAQLCDARQRLRVDKVRFLATSWVLRGTWGRNEDTYLAELTLSSEYAPSLIRLIDNYPNEFPSLPLSVLTSQIGTVIRVSRDEECDIPLSQMTLRLAPGDPMAILLERLNYQPQLPTTVAPDEKPPCNRTVRR
jgi:hypothetical protein